MGEYNLSFKHYLFPFLLSIPTQFVVGCAAKWLFIMDNALLSAKNYFNRVNAASEA